MRLVFNPADVKSYRQFLAVKRLPIYSIQGREAWFPDEYASLVGLGQATLPNVSFDPSPFLFDYQRDIARIAVRKRKFAVFADCGLGKTLIFMEFARVAQSDLGNRQGTLIVSPLMVVPQTIAEAQRFYGDTLPIEQVAAKDLPKWLASCGGKIGITNYDALTDAVQSRGQLGALILDESSMLKSHYGKWGQKCLELGAGLEWKLSGTGTPAPNDRIEYANQAVFLDAFPTVNSFLAKFFVNRGQTAERWEIKPHAIKSFYRALSHWCIFLNSPATYGWKDNADPLPPIHIHDHHVDLTAEQVAAIGTETGKLFATDLGGITSRSTMGSLAKGKFRGKAIATNKPRAIRELVDSWPDESTIIWCKYNHEQESLEKEFPEAASISGSTKLAKRIELIDEFKAGKRRQLISKPKVLGFGLNLQVATRHVLSGLEDSYEAFYQCIKRSNRYGSTKPLNVHIPVTDVERPMIETVLRKADRVQADTEEQEALFRSESLTLFQEFLS